MTGAGPSRADAGAIPRFITPGTVLAVLLVTVSGILNALAPSGVPLSDARLLVLIGLGVVHAALGTIGVHRVERRQSHRLLRAHLAVALAVAVAAIVVSRGFGFLIALSLVSQGVLYLPARGAAAIAAVCALVSVGAFATSGLPSDEIPPYVIGVASSMAFVIVFSYIVVRQRRTQAEVERLAAELADANERLRAYASEVEELATQRERNRIAREIHDGLGHFLTVVHVQLDAAQTMLTRDPAAAERAIARAKQLTHEGLDEVRRSVSVLRGSTRGATAAESLVGAIEKLAGECTGDGLDVKVELSGSPRPLADALAFTIYRAAQEAITNVRRHAQASTIRIELAFAEPERVRLRVADDGVGSADGEPGADEPQGGFGLLGLRERAELCGGTLSVSAARGRGFTLELELPG